MRTPCPLRRIASVALLALGACSGSRHEAPPEVRAPVEVSVLEPAPGATVQNPVGLVGTAFQAGAPLEGSRLSWASDVDGPLGKGSSLVPPHLSHGWHTVTLTAQGEAGEPGAATVRFEVVAWPVTASIASPGDGSTHVGSVAFQGEASQGGQALPDAALEWSSDVDGPLDEGRSFVRSDLSPGEHTITLRAVGAGASGEASVRMAVTYVTENRSARSLVPALEDAGPVLAVSRMEVSTAVAAAVRFAVGATSTDGSTADGREHAAVVTTDYGEGEPQSFGLIAAYEGGKRETAELAFPWVNRETFRYSGDVRPRMELFGGVAASIDERHGTISGVNVVFLPGRALESSLAKESVFTLEENTAAEVYASVRASELALAGLASSEWRVLTEDQRRAAFLLNAVAFLWHHGNFERTSAVGCVQMNERITQEEADSLYATYPDGPIYWRLAHGMRDFLRSSIGCCADRAFLLQVLLEQAGLEARRIALPDHSLNEARLDGRWHTLDATAGVLVDRSVQEMLEAPGRTVYVFFSPYLDPASPLYSPVIAPWFPTVSIGFGLPGSPIQYGAEIESVGYSPRELAQMGGR